MLAFGNAHAQEDYVQYETIYLKPDTEKLATFSQNMKAHNDRYHSEAPYNASVWRVASGPDAGWLVWVMGPSTFSHMDNRPESAAHDEDWASNILSNIDDMGTIEYWRLDQDLSVVTGESLPNLYIRYYKVNNEMSFLLGDVMAKMSATRKAMPEGRQWAWYNNMFQQGDLGRHFASITPFASWSELDNGMDLDPSSPGSFRPTFEGLYGAGAWTPYSRSLGEVFEDSHTAIWVLMPGMSAPSPDN